MHIPENIIEILREKDCEEVASRLGIEVRRHKAFCFLHSESVPSLSFNPKKPTMWKCFSCNKGGNAINLVMEHEKLDFVSACRCLCNMYGITLNSQPFTRTYRRSAYKVTPSNFAFKGDDTKKFDNIIGEWLIENLGLGECAKKFLFTDRKLKEEIIYSLNIRSVENFWNLKDKLISLFGLERCKQSGLFNDRGNLAFWTPCLIFPYYDKNKGLIGLQTRYLGNDSRAPRFQFLSKEKTHLFNLPILNTIVYGESIYISEGITDCLALLSSGKNAIALPSATLVPQEEIILLRRYQVYMFPDNDEAGQVAFSNIQSLLIEYGGYLYEEQLAEGFKDYSEYYLNTISSI